MALSNTSFDNRLSMTIAAWVSNNFADLITGHNPVFTKLREQGNVRKGGGHGGQFIEPLMFPNGSGGAVTGVADATAAYTDPTFAETTGFTSAAYKPAEIIMPISVQEYELDAQGSDTEKVGLVESVMQSSFATFMETVNGQLWANEEATNAAGARASLGSLRAYFNGGGSATTDGGNTPSALAEQVGNRAVASASTQTPAFTIGGINRNAAGAAYWCTPIINTPQSLSAQVLSSLVTKATRGVDRPDLIVLHRDMYDKLMGILMTNPGGGGGGQPFTQSKLADAGFEAIRFRGCDVIADDHCPATAYLNGASTAYAYNAFCINTKYLKLRALSMKPDVKEFPTPKRIRAWRAAWTGQITSGNLGRVHSRHVNLS